MFGATDGLDDCLLDFAMSRGLNYQFQVAILLLVLETVIDSFYAASIVEYEPGAHAGLPKANVSIRSRTRLAHDRS